MESPSARSGGVGQVGARPSTRSRVGAWGGGGGGGGGWHKDGSGCPNSTWSRPPPHHPRLSPAFVPFPRNSPPAPPRWRWPGSPAAPPQNPSTASRSGEPRGERSMAALMTKLRSPRVTTRNGKERMTTTGLDEGVHEPEHQGHHQDVREARGKLDPIHQVRCHHQPQGIHQEAHQQVPHLHGVPLRSGCGGVAAARPPDTGSRPTVVNPPPLPGVPAERPRPPFVGTPVPSGPTLHVLTRIPAMPQRRHPPRARPGVGLGLPPPPPPGPHRPPLEVVFNGVVVASTRNGYRVLETSHPPVYYIPPGMWSGAPQPRRGLQRLRVEGRRPLLGPGGGWQGGPEGWPGPTPSPTPPSPPSGTTWPSTQGGWTSAGWTARW